MCTPLTLAHPEIYIPPSEPVRLFRWRNYRDYGTGVAGDLFVHLFSGMHFITGAIGPERIYATGGLRFWKDGRDVPDAAWAELEASDNPFATVVLAHLHSQATRRRPGQRLAVAAHVGVQVVGDDPHHVGAPRGLGRGQGRRHCHECP